MRKGIKILGKVVSAIILLLVVVPFILSMLLDIPAVQNFVVQRSVALISRNLETRVAIDHIQVGFFSRVHIKGFYVEDYQRDTLLYVDELTAHVTSFGFAGGGLSLSDGKIQNAKLYLRETPRGVMNIKEVVNRISDPNRVKKGKFRLSLKRASVQDMTLVIERLKHRNPVHGIDFWDMRMENLCASVQDFTIDGPAIYTTISALSVREKSGFELENFAGMFYLVNGCLGFQQVEIATRRSHVEIPYISLVGNSWREYKDFLGEVRLDALMRNTTLSTDDIAYFSPKLRDWHLDFSDIEVEMRGMVDDFTGTLHSLRVGEETSLRGEMKVQGLPDVRNTHFDLQIPSLCSSAEDLSLMAERMARKELPASLLAVLGRTGEIDVQANFKGRFSSFAMQAEAKTGVGTANCDLQLNPLGEGLQHFSGSLFTRDLQVGRLLDKQPLLGQGSLSAWVDGSLGQGKTDANVVGTITGFEVNGYRYDSLRMEGRLRNRGFDGHIEAKDPNMDFDFVGMVNFRDSIPRYDFTLDLRHADLAKVYINHRDSLSQLSAKIKAQASGVSLDDLNGTIHISDARYRYNDKEVTSARATITGQNSSTHKLMELRSDFADATFRSRMSYRRVYDYLRRFALNYVPTLQEHPRGEVQAVQKRGVANDFSLLSVHIHDFNPVADAIAEGLQVADGSSLQLLFNPASDQLSLKVTSDYIERRRMLATRLAVNASNRGDSLMLYASAEDLYAGALHLPNLSLTGGAKEHLTQLSVGFRDSLRQASGLLSVRAELLKQQDERGRVVDVRILPSHITRGDETWQVFARKIQLDTAQVVVDRFFVTNRDQQLYLNGVASRSLDDSLTLRLRNFDISPLTQFTNRMGYNIEGHTDGQALMRSVLRGGEISADIRLDSVQVNTIPAPPMRLTSKWDFAQSRANLTVTNRLKRDTLVRGFFDPAQMRYRARFQTDSLELRLLDPILTGVISSTEGIASAELLLQGERREADLTGEIRISDMRTKVDYTQVEYQIPSAVMQVRNNHFSVKEVPVFDAEQNQGVLDFDLSLQHLSNIAYDLRVRPQQMLLLNTTQADNEQFYGKVYGSGRARISGDKGNVKMEITAATEGRSSFFMPLSNKTNISYADFVTFKQPENTAISSVELKKQLFERRHKQRKRANSEMDIALTLDVQPNVEVELMVAGNAVKARGEGMLNLHINPTSNLFEMYGDYNISEGNYNFSLQNIINKRFVIESGSTIQWTGAPMDAQLNIDAIYKLKASLQPLLQTTVSADGHVSGDRSTPVECVIHIGDQLTNPTITFDVQLPGSDPETQAIVANTLNTPEQVDMQFLYLLLFNSFYDENASSNANIGTSVSAATGLEFLSNMVSNLLSADDYNIVLRYRPSSELTSEEVDFGLSKSLINNRLLVEVEGNYLIDNKQAVNGSMSNFMGEAYITYLIDKAGTLKLKAFTQTIDRFDENQGLQETGLGIYFKQDFNNFHDFRQRIKERFTNPQKQAKRRARKEAKAAEQAQKRAEKEMLKAVEQPDYSQEKTNKQ